MKFLLILIPAFVFSVSCQKEKALDISGKWDINHWVEGEENYYVNNNDIEASITFNADGSLLIEIEDEEMGLLGSDGKFEVDQKEGTITFDFNDGDIFGENDDIIDASLDIGNDTLKINGNTGGRSISLVMVK